MKSKKDTPFSTKSENLNLQLSFHLPRYEIMALAMICVISLSGTINMAFGGSSRNSRRGDGDNYSWGDSDDSNCPDLGDYATALNSVRDDDGSSLIDLYSSDSDFRLCIDGDINNGCIYNATDRVNGFLYFASISSSFDIQFRNKKYGEYYASADWKFDISLYDINNNNNGQECEFTMYGTMSVFCDENGKIIEEYPLHNQQQQAAIFAGCV